MNKKVAIIGAGPSGLAQLRAFQSAQTQGVNVPEIVCFEKQENWGGLWNYSWRTGLDGHGEPVHNSMYRYLWSNGPKECLEFADYTFEEHFGKPIASYPPRAVLWDYIKGRVEKAGVRDKIRFNTIVRNVQFNEKTNQFTLTAQDMKKDSMSDEVFDYVIVANGHFSTPAVPFYPGFESFNGRIMHAHDFRDALEFKDQDILIVGSSYSAEDIGSQCFKYGCRSITSSHRSGPIGYHWPDNWTEKPAISHVDNRTVHFVDGTTTDVHAIVLCTGYLHHFPFLPDELRLKTANILYPENLYKGVVWEGNTKLFYLGMQDQWYTFNMFDAQAWYARDVILGRINLPSQSEMQAHTKTWMEREGTLVENKDMIYFQGDYVQMLIDETDYPSFDVKGVNETFLEWKHDKHDDIMGYRNKSYKSLMTGNQSPPHHTEWLKELDDSMESYLRI